MVIQTNPPISEAGLQPPRFHLSESATIPTDSAWGMPETILKPVMENFRILDKVDATFLARWQRDLFYEIARRATQVQDASEADIRVLQHQIETAEALGDDELNDVMQQTVQQKKSRQI